MQPSTQRISVAVCHLLVWGAVAAAQSGGTPLVPPQPATPGGTTEPALGPVRLAPLGTIHLSDKNGKLVPLPGDWTLEQFQDRVNQQVTAGLGSGDEIPQYVIESLVATGQVRRGVAELKVRLTLILRAPRWFRIPLEMGEAAMSGPPDENGTGGSLLTLAENRSDEARPPGYILWLQGGAEEQKREVELDLLVPVVTLGSQTRLALSMPRAASSELRLTVPGENVAAEVSGGAILETLQQPGDKTTSLTVRGLRGDLQLAWRQSQPGDSADSNVVITSLGTILATVERNAVRWDARLVLRGYGGPLEHLRVLLPAGALPVKEEYSGYTVEDVTPEGETAADQRVVEIRFDQPAKNGQAVEVRLAARQARARAGPAAMFDLSGFEVVGAIRQSGFLGIHASDAWNVRFATGRGVRQVTDVPEELTWETFAATFEYFEQPFSLSARVFPRQTRISVDPRYVMFVEKDMVRLEATLKYTVRGKKVDDLLVEMPGWKLDGVGPDETVVTEGVELDDSHVLSINLIEAALDEFEITIRAHQPIARDASQLNLALPRPMAGSRSPAAVFVVPADNVELVPNPKATTGLTREQVAPPIELPDRQQKPLFYRGGTIEAVFAAGIRVHQQSIAVDCSCEVALAQGAGRVTQRLVYDVKYEAAESLMLEVPAALAESNDLQFLYAGDPITAVDPIDDSKQPQRSGVVFKQVVLPGPAKGRCELEVSFSISLDDLQPLASSLWPIPLVMPAEGELISNSVHVTAEPGMRILSHEDHWAAVEAEAASGGEDNQLWLTTDRRAAKVVLRVHLDDPDTSGSTVVERAWIQTWLADGQRHDRAVFRVTSDQKYLELNLPEGVDPSAVTVSVDAVEVAVETSPEGHLIVELPHSTADRLVLEVWYRFSQPGPARGEILLQLPRLGPNAWTRRTYWQLILPQNEHLILPPQAWTPEFRWGWTGTYWGRIPTMEQPRLELWVGAKQETPVPEATSRYLFSGFAEAPQARFRTAGRIWIVGWASGSVLLGGLLVIYIPILRHPLPVFFFLVGLVAAAVAFPALLLLLGQAAGMGLAMALLGGILYRGVSRRRPWVARRESSSFILERSSTRMDRSPTIPEDTATQPEGTPVN